MRETSSISVSHAVVKCFQTVSVAWELGNDATITLTDADELRLVAVDGSVLVRICLSDVDRLRHASLSSASVSMVCPGFGGDFALCLYSVSRRCRVVGVPLTVVGTPLDRGVGKVHVEVLADRALRLEYAPEELFGGVFLLCPADCGDNDGHMDHGLFSSLPRTGLLQHKGSSSSSNDDTMFQLIADDAPHVVVAARSSIGGQLRHAFVVCAPRVPGIYEVRYLKSSLAPIPHCVACSGPFPIGFPRKVLIDGRTGASDEQPEALARSSATEHATPGTLVVSPTKAHIAESVAVRWSLLPLLLADDWRPSDGDRILWHPLGREELLQPTEAWAAAGVITGKQLVEGTVLVTAPNVEGLYDAVYFSGIEGRPILRSTEPLRVLAPMCHLSRRFAAAQVVTAASFEAQGRGEVPRAVDELALATIDVIVPQHLCADGDFVVVKSGKDGGIVARVCVNRSACEAVPVSELRAIFRHQLGEDERNHSALPQLLRTAVLLPMETLAVAHFSASQAVTLHYFSRHAARLLDGDAVLLDGLPEDLASQASHAFPDLDLVAPARIDCGAAISASVVVARGPQPGSVRGWIAAVVPLGVPDICFRADDDEAGAIQAVTAAHFTHLEELEAGNSNDARVTLPGLDEPGTYSFRVYGFLSLRGAASGSSSFVGGMARRTCFSEAIIEVVERRDVAAGDEDDKAEGLSVESNSLANPAPCIARFPRAVAMWQQHEHPQIQQELILNQDNHTAGCEGETSRTEVSSPVGVWTLTRRRTLRRSFMFGSGAAGTTAALRKLNRYEPDGSSVSAMGVPSVVKFSIRPDFRGAIFVVPVTDNHSSVTVTIHVLDGVVHHNDSLLLLDEYCSCVVRRIGVSEDASSTGRSDGTLVTLTLPRIEMPGVYHFAYWSVVCNAVVFASKPVTVTPLLAPREILERGAVREAYVAAAKQMKQRRLLDLVSTYPVVQPQLVGFRAVLVGCSYSGVSAAPSAGFASVLRGPANDVTRMKALLVDTLMVPADHITVLCEDISASASSAAPREDQPTAVNIQKALGAAEAQLCGGGTFIFYFSGLGSCFKPLSRSLHRADEAPILETALLPCDYDWGPRMLYYRTLLGHFKRLQQRGVHCVAFVDAGFSPSGSSSGLDSRNWHLKNRLAAGVDAEACVRAMQPPPGSATWKPGGRASGCNNTLLHRAGIRMAPQELGSSNEETHGGTLALYEAGRKTVWEGFTKEEGATVGAFTAALCRVIRSEHERLLQQRKREVQSSLAFRCEKASYEELKDMLKDRDAEATAGANMHAQFPTWECVHELVLQRLWNSPFCSQKPKLMLQSQQQFLGPALRWW